MTARWQAALGFALTGSEFDLAEPGRPDPEALLVALDAAGWTAARIGEHARSSVLQEAVWPHQVPDAVRQGCGAAQFAAALGVARRLLGLTSLDVRPPSGRIRLNPDEERLLREVPPHHGS